jgi:hypothetical protein
MLEETRGPEGVRNFEVGVYRVLVGDTPELARERQRARTTAILAEFKTQDGLDVSDWGDTEDEEPHELVVLLVAVAGQPAVQAAAGSVIAWIGMKLADKAVDEAISAGFKTLARKIFRTQKAEQRVSDAWVTGPDGSPRLELFPPEWVGGPKRVAQIVFDDGSSVIYQAPPGGWTGDPDLDPSPERLES